MRSRDEVLREFGADELTRLLPLVVAEGVERMADHIAAVEQQRDEYHRLWKAEVLKGREQADRIRELEAQLAASERGEEGNGDG